jgi:hypothetical protein
MNSFDPLREENREQCQYIINVSYLVFYILSKHWYHILYIRWCVLYLNESYLYFRWTRRNTYKNNGYASGDVYTRYYTYYQEYWYPIMYIMWCVLCIYKSYQHLNRRDGIYLIIMVMHQVMYIQDIIHMIENIEILLYTSCDVHYVYTRDNNI